MNKLSYFLDLICTALVWEELLFLVFRLTIVELVLTDFFVQLFFVLRLNIVNRRLCSQLEQCIIILRPNFCTKDGFNLTF